MDTEGSGGGPPVEERQAPAGFSPRTMSTLRSVTSLLWLAVAVRLAWLTGALLPLALAWLAGQSLLLWFFAHALADALRRRGHHVEPVAHRHAPAVVGLALLLAAAVAALM